MGTETIGKSRILFLISIGLAGVALATIIAAPQGYMISVVIVALWIALVLYALVKFKVRGLWFLIGAPLIILWFVFLLAVRACVHEVGACL